jgi:nucleotide-binding universal stress UspA family protein
MERILVIMNDRHYPWEALGRAMSLAKRIGARVYILKIFPKGSHVLKVVDQDLRTTAGTRFENMIQTARAEQTGIEYFVTEGDFEEEVIRFVEQNKISILVVETGGLDGKDPEHPGKALGPLKEILYRISCRVELVSPKKQTQL